MALLRFISLACASALLVAQANIQTANSQNEGEPAVVTVTYSVALSKSVVCLDEINEARGAAGLQNFVEATTEEQKMPVTNDAGDKPWDPVCKALIEEAEEAAAEKVSGRAASLTTGTYAFMALSSDQANCTAAVDHWKAAFSNFTSIPPAKTEEATIYKDQQNISFVAMYNPINGAAADCRVVTCTKNAGSNQRSLRNTPEEGYALLCKTTPDAFTDGKTAPFTDDQWSKIKTSLTGSASAVAPSLLAFVAVGLGLAAL